MPEPKAFRMLPHQRPCVLDQLGRRWSRGGRILQSCRPVFHLGTLSGSHGRRKRGGQDPIPGGVVRGKEGSTTKGAKGAKRVCLGLCPFDPFLFIHLGPGACHRRALFLSTARLDRFARGYATAVNLSSTGATAANISSPPTTTGTAFPAASPNCPGLEWQKVLVRHGDWTRDAVAFVAVRRGGWRLSELVGRIGG